MYRFLLRPRWLAFHALVVVAIVVMINLGFWQLRRLDERREFNATVDERIEQPVVPLDALLAAPGFEPAAAEWRAVSVSGSYLRDQILVFNRSQGGRAGDNVLTPLQRDDGLIVVVNRGFVPLGATVPEPPTVAVEIVGRARPSQLRGELRDDLGQDPITEIRRVEIERLAPQLPGPVAPVYLDLVTSDPAVATSDPAPVPAPALSSGPHLSYAVQWFVFSIAVAVGWVLAIRRSVARRRRDDAVTGAAAERDGAGSPSPAATAAASSRSGTAGSSSG